MKISRLCVAIPNLGSIKAETVTCLVGSLFYIGCNFTLLMPCGCYIDENRNNAAREALAMGASHLMFIDSDMAFPDNGIATLASRDKRVIGANYNKRKLPPESTVKTIGGKGIPTYPFKCEVVATGFMLIQTDIFKILDKPWFFYEYDSEQDDTIGEDVYFCKKAQAKGIDVWCDPTIEVKHIGDYLY